MGSAIKTTALFTILFLPVTFFTVALSALARKCLAERLAEALFPTGPFKFQSLHMKAWCWLNFESIGLRNFATYSECLRMPDLVSSVRKEK